MVATRFFHIPPDCFEQRVFQHNIPKKSKIGFWLRLCIIMFELARKAKTDATKCGILTRDRLIAR